MPQMDHLAAAGASDSLLQARSEELLRQSKAHAASGDPELQKAAKSFEAILLNKWLEEAQKSFASVPGEDPDQANTDPGSDQFRSLAMQSLAEKIADSGGIGIAAMIIRQLEKKPANPAAEGPQAADSTSSSGNSTDVGTKRQLPPLQGIKVLPGKDR